MILFENFEEKEREQIWDNIVNQYEGKIAENIEKINSHVVNFDRCIGNNDIKGMRDEYSKVATIQPHSKEEALFLTDVLTVLANRILIMKREEETKMNNVKFEKATNEEVWQDIINQVEINTGNTVKHLADIMEGFQDCVARKDIEGMRKAYSSMAEIEPQTKAGASILADAMELVANKILEMRGEV